MAIMGTVIVSVDAELGWGFFDTPEPPMDRLTQSVWGWHQLCCLCDRYEIPATWAVVGHLFLDQCDGFHYDHPLGPDRFEREQTEWASETSLRFGPSLIEDLLSSDVDHEIGSHSFSHIDFESDLVTEDVVRAEFTQFEAAVSDELSVDSFVYPRNHIQYREILAESGMLCYRGSSPTRRRDRPVRRKVGKLWQATVTTPPLVSPTVDEYGLVNIPASLYLFGFEGYGRTIAELLGTDPVVRQAVRGIDRVADTDKLFHLWLHPNNIMTTADVKRLDAIWSYLASARDDRRVTIKTMGEVAREAKRDRTLATSRTDAS